MSWRFHTCNTQVFRINLTQFRSILTVQRDLIFLHSVLQHSTQADIDALMEQMQYLHCIVDPCLYGGRCEVVNFDEIPSEWETEIVDGNIAMTVDHALPPQHVREDLESWP